MGQQLSSESYCLATVQKLICELNTTDSQVSESHVTSNSDSCGGGGGCIGGDGSGDGSGGGYCRITFPWREWARVSKYLERVLPNSEQKRLLTHVLLDQTGLRDCNFAAADEDDGDLDSYNGGGVPGGSAGVVGGGFGPQPTAASRWSVHLNYGDETDKNAVLYRDFVKLHFQLDGLSTPAASCQQSLPPSQAAAGCGSRDSGLSSLSTTSALGAELTDRLIDLLRQQCDRIGVGLVVTKAVYHSRDSCAVISCTIDIRSILRNTGSLELRSRVNFDVEDPELGDQLQRSLSGLRDRIASQQQLQQLQQQQQQQVHQMSYFPMALYFCSSNKRVILIYGQQQRSASSA